MDKSIINRIKKLEDKAPSDLIVYAITDKEEVVEARVKDVLTEDGELKKGYKGVGVLDVGLVKRGSSLKDLERILRFQQGEADVEQL